MILNIFSFGRKKRIRELEKELMNVRFELEGLKYEINNFPPYAITSIPNNQLEEIFKENNEEVLRHLLNEYMKFIEQHDLAVDFMLVPKVLYAKLKKMMKEDMSENKELWGMKIIPIDDLNSSILFSNIKVSDKCILLNDKNKCRVKS